MEPMSRRPRPQIVSLSDAAAARVKEIMSSSGKPYLRVGVNNGGCAGMEYVLEYADAPEAMDELIEDHDVRIVIKADAVLFLLGSVIDFETTRLASKFVFRNPNQTDACGCGESVTLTPARLDS
jgi:iron-sulfur cluster assembly protein